MKQLGSILLMLAIAAGALYLVLSNVHWEGTPEAPGVADALAKVDWGLFGVGLLCFFGLHVSRAVRWGRLIQALRPDIGFRSYFSMCSVGFFLINILPFRLGEFVRPYLLLDREEVPFGSGMATVVVERVLDILALGLLFTGVLLFADVPAWTVEVAGDEGQVESYDIIRFGRVGLLGAGVPFGGALIALLLAGERGVELARRVVSPFSSRVADLLVGFLRSFLLAVRALGSGKAMASVLFWTLLAWGINAASMWIMALGFGMDIGFWDGAAILVCVCVVLIVPPTPGFVGVFELGVVMALALYGEPKSLGLAFGGLVHLAQFLMLGILGTSFLLIDRISLGALMRGMKEARGA